LGKVLIKIVFGNILMFAKQRFSKCIISSYKITSFLPLPNIVLSLKKDLKQRRLFVIVRVPDSKILA
jgi:hypothetical protein